MLVHILLQPLCGAVTVIKNFALISVPFQNNLAATVHSIVFHNVSILKPTLTVKKVVVTFTLLFLL